MSGTEEVICLNRGCNHPYCPFHSEYYLEPNRPDSDESWEASMALMTEKEDA